MFIQKPAFTISSIFNSLVLNTAALGGVDMGNINAQEDAKATTAIIPYGATPIPAARPTLIGISILDTAVLDIISVMNKTVVVKIIKITK